MKVFKTKTTERPGMSSTSRCNSLLLVVVAFLFIVSILDSSITFVHAAEGSVRGVVVGRRLQDVVTATATTTNQDPLAVVQVDNENLSPVESGGGGDANDGSGLASTINEEEEEEESDPTSQVVLVVPPMDGTVTEPSPAGEKFAGDGDTTNGVSSNNEPANTATTTTTTTTNTGQIQHDGDEDDEEEEEESDDKDEDNDSPDNQGQGQQPKAICQGRINDTSEKLLECVSGTAVKQHIDKISELATERMTNMASSNHGDDEPLSPPASRNMGSTGYDSSVDYVTGILLKVGYNVRHQSFETPGFRLGDNPELQVFEQTIVLSPPPLVDTATSGTTTTAAAANTNAANQPPAQTTTTRFELNSDYKVFTYSGMGDVTSKAQAIDIVIDPTEPGASSSGCEPEDFVDFVPGNIAIIQRGTCWFSKKVEYAVEAGAVGVIIFNEGQEGRRGVIGGTLKRGASLAAIPVIGVSYELGIALATTASGDDTQVVRIAVDASIEMEKTVNILAELPQGDPNSIIMIGAHLDSVKNTIGANDNLSGSASILEVAIQLAGVVPVNKVRFAWWGGEERGLLGSKHFVRTTTDDEYDAIKMYLNFDMIASPNYIYTIADSILNQQPAPTGTETMIEIFQQYYNERDIPNKIAPSGSCRDDSCSFVKAGIPSTALFTGAEQLKTVEEASIWGGEADVPYDVCYHRNCDASDHINVEALNVNVGAIAYSVIHFAMQEYLFAAAAEAVSRDEYLDKRAVRLEDPLDTEPQDFHHFYGVWQF